MHILDKIYSLVLKGDVETITRNKSYIVFEHGLRNPIISFEANPMFQGVLEYVKTKIDDFEFHLTGAGDRDEQIVLHTPVVDGRIYHQESSVRPENFEESWVQDRFKSYGVNVSFVTSEIHAAPLDQFGLDPAIIKVDVEGNEVAVLTGLGGNNSTQQAGYHGGGQLLPGGNGDAGRVGI